MSNYFQLIQQNQQYSPYFQNGFSNHLPMVLYCTKRMGASEAVIEYQASELRWEYYHKKYNLPFEKPEPSQGRISNANWNNFKGDYNLYPDYLDWIKREGVVSDASFLVEVLDQLKGYQTGSLFHAMIRFSMGLDDQHISEMEIALAYWLSCAGDRPEQTKPIYGHSYIDDLNALLYDFKDSVNFVSLHYITGFVAIQNMPQNLKEIFLPYYAGALNRYVSDSNFKYLDSSKEKVSHSLMEKAKEVAFKSVDDHVVKGIYALLELDKMAEFRYLSPSIERLMGTLY